MKKKDSILVAGAVALSGPTLLGCDPGDALPVDDVQQPDWAQYEGKRNPEMVRYFGSFWSECANPNTRFGCGTMDVFVKLRIKPVPGASLDHKEVGVVHKNPYDGRELTAYGYYYATWSDGYEEWHVPVSVPAWRDFFVFNAFYRDGAGQTYYDDNAGELHVVNAGPDNQIIRVNTYRNTVAVTDAGVTGKVSLWVADLDYDKRIRMVATVDGWQTVLDFGMGQPGDKNAWYWVEDTYGGEMWEIDLDLPGDFQELQYAVQYQHGVVNEATTYGFWANAGGQNYRVTRQPVVE